MPNQPDTLSPDRDAKPRPSVAEITIVAFIGRMKDSRAKIEKSRAAIKDPNGWWHGQHAKAPAVYGAAIEAAEAAALAVLTETTT